MTVQQNTQNEVAPTGKFHLDDIAALHKQIEELTAENAAYRAFVAAYDADAGTVMIGGTKMMRSTYATRQAVIAARKAIK